MAGAIDRKNKSEIKQLLILSIETSSQFKSVCLE